MEKAFALVFIAVMATLVISILFSYFFAEAGQEDHAWWMRCRDKLARARRLILPHKQQK
jgi:hypothetical protein